MVTVLAGGTGGALLARGLLDVVGARELAVIVNTGDDVEMYGVHVSPDPDLVAYTLAGAADIATVDLGADVAVLDAASCVEGWAAAVAEIREAGREPLIVVLGDDDDVESAVEAARARVTGWLPRSAVVEDLVEVVRIVGEGGGSYPPRHLGPVLRALWADTERSTSTTDRVASLTERERHVLQQLVEGLAAREIAEQADLSINTVRTHIGRLFRKLGVHHRLEAVRVARAAGLLPDAPGQ